MQWNLCQKNLYYLLTPFYSTNSISSAVCLRSFLVCYVPLLSVLLAQQHFFVSRVACCTSTASYRTASWWLHYLQSIEPEVRLLSWH